MDWPAILSDGNDPREKLGLISGDSSLTVSAKKYDARLSPYSEGEYYGIHVSVLYRGDVSKYKKTNWIQSAITDLPIAGFPSKKKYNDVGQSKYGTIAPFYYPNSGPYHDFLTTRNQQAGGILFLDRSSRLGGRNMTRVAGVSLVGLNNSGRWENIITYTFSYSIDNNYNINISGFRESTPSFYQMSLIMLAK